MKIIQTILFTFLLFAIFGGCRKPEIQPSSVFVKLFPNDSSYQAGGGFQLANGNFVIYGFDSYNNGVNPIIIITDQHGKILHTSKLSSKFHFLTIKPVMNKTMMLAVGLESFESVTENVCLIDADGTPGAVWEYDINIVEANTGTLPDFVEDSTSFVISGYGIDPVQSPNKKVPFVLRIGKSGELIRLTKFLPGPSTNFQRFTTNISQWEGGTCICGYGNYISQYPYKGLFYMKLNRNDSLVWDTVIFDNTQGVAVQLLESANGATVLCGADSGKSLNGILYTMFAFHNDSLDRDSFGEKHHYNGYENLARFTAVSRTSDGGYILSAVVGIVEGSIVDFHPQFYILKINSELESQWFRIFNSYPSYNIASVVQTADGGYLLCGLEHTASYVYTMVMIKTDANGNIVPD